MIEVKNARISGTMLGVEDHGILSAYVYLDYGGSGQGFGGYALDRWDDGVKKRVANGACGLFVARVLEVVGVATWETLQGKSCRVRATHDRVVAIGHFLEDKWFEPESEFKKLV